MITKSTPPQPSLKFSQIVSRKDAIPTIADVNSAASPANHAISNSASPTAEAAQVLRQKLRGVVRGLNVTQQDDRVILTGQCVSYHAKQQITCAALQVLEDAVICNHVHVNQ